LTWEKDGTEGEALGSHCSPLLRENRVKEKKKRKSHNTTYIIKEKEKKERLIEKKCNSGRKSRGRSISPEICT